MLGVFFSVHKPITVTSLPAGSVGEMFGGTSTKPVINVLSAGNFKLTSQFVCVSVQGSYRLLPVKMF